MAAIDSISESLNAEIWDFSYDLARSLVELYESNMIMSTLSLYTVLAMLSLGAKGKTLNILQCKLKLPADKSHIQSYYETLQKYLNDAEDIDVKLANKIFNSEKIAILSDFKSDLREIFQSEVQNLNYSDSVKAAQTINDWIAEATKRKIQHSFSADAINAETALILVNAISFKGPWKYSFQPQDTADMDWTLFDETKIKVPTMFLNADLKYGIGFYDVEFLNWIELPFKNEEFSMVLIAFGPDDKPSNMQKIVYKTNYTELLKSGEQGNVNLYMPKFKIQSEWHLEKILREIGFDDIFDENADFSGISKAPLRVTDVVQKAFINVDEAGCEAAASTGYRLVRESTKSPFEFRIDKLFWYIIVHKEKGAVDSRKVTPLLFGTVYNPVQS